MRERWWEVLVATEATIVALVLLLSAWQFYGWASPPIEANAAPPDTLATRIPSFGMFSLLLGVAAVAGLYGVLQFLRRTQTGFLMLAVTTLLPQGPGVWNHNSLEWGRFLVAGPSLGEGYPVLLSAGLFVASLVGLVVLHRVVAARKFGGLLVDMRADGSERDRVLIGEGKALVGIIGVSLAVALLLVLGGSALGRSNWLSEALPWAVLTIGGGASLLLTGFTVLFLRALNRD